MCAQLLSHVRFIATPWTVAHQTPLSMKFPDNSTGAGCHFILQGIFLTQGSNPCLLHGQADSLSLHHLGSPLVDTSLQFQPPHSSRDQVKMKSYWIWMGFNPMTCVLVEGETQKRHTHRGSLPHFDGNKNWTSAATSNCQELSATTRNWKR